LRILAWVKFERKKHFWGILRLLESSDRMTDGGFAALIALISDHLKDSVGGIALFGGKLLILTKEGFDTTLVGAKDGSRLGTNQRCRDGLLRGKSLSNGLATPAFFFSKLADAFLLQAVM
jgi:hypothetical protein